MEKMLQAFQAGQEENRHQSAFFILLAKLVGTSDFAINLHGMSLRVQQVVKALHNDSRLRAECFAVAETATSSCADSAEAMLRMIETAILCNDISSGQHSMHEAYVLGMAHFRLDVVREIATRKVERSFTAEPLEVHLAYETALREELRLPVIGVGMRFSGVSGVTPDDLANASEEVRQRESAHGGEEAFRFLCAWMPWIALVRKQNLTAFAAIENEFDSRMAALFDNRNDMPNDRYLESVNELSHGRSEAIRLLIRELSTPYRKAFEPEKLQPIAMI
jgi:hypothetical protein